ncbi:MAG: plastocyanin/azurin family copper-binding protein [Paracoccaceae bacterium]
MKTLSTLSAAAILSFGLAMPAAAQSTEPDCPEDFDTQPGCDMSPMDDPDYPVNLSNRQPVSGGTTAPTSPDGERARGEKTLAGPETAGNPAPEGGESATGSEEASSDEADTDTAASESSESGTEMASAPTGEASAPTTHEVQARGVQFVPAIIYVRPGDKVNWTNMASHNVETIDEMVPEGQEKVNSTIGENVQVTFDTTGIVVYKCTPHWGNRMGGIVVVGEPENPGELIQSYMDSTTEHTQNLPARGLLKDLREDMEEKGMI